MNRNTASMLLLALLSGIGTGALAQTATNEATPATADGSASNAPSSSSSSSPSASADVQEVVVTTARFKSESVQKVGASISVIGSKQIEQAGLVDFEDIARNTPGIQNIDRGPNQNTVAIRGIAKPISPATTDILTSRALAALYVDDIPVNTLSGNDRDFNLDDMNRVEVLRGPQPTYFGEGSVGGTIRYFSSDPTLHAGGPQGEVNAGLSSTDGGGSNIKYQGAVDLTLAPDVLGIRLSGFTRRDAGFIDNSTLGTSSVNNFQSHGARAVILAKPTDRLTVRFAASGEQDNAGDQWSITPGSDPKDLTVNSRVPGGATDYYNLYSLKLDYAMDQVTFTSVTGAYDRKRNSSFYSPTYTAYVAGGNALINPTTTSNVGYEDNNLTQEFRFVTHLPGAFNYTGGLFFKNGDFKEQINVLAPGIAPISGIFIPPITFIPTNSQALTAGTTHVHTNQYSGFLEGTWTATDRLRLIGGARYVNEKLTAAYDANSFAYAAVPVFGGIFVKIPSGAVLASAGKGLDFNLTMEKVLPRAAIEYDLDTNKLAYASVAKGARNGMVNAVVSAVLASGTPFNPSAFNQFITYSEDQATSYEAGLKTLNWDNTLKLNVAAFYTDWTNIQTLTGSPFSLIQNVGGARSEGLEFESSLKVNSHVSLFMNAAFTDAIFTSTVANGFELISSGNQMPGVPKNTLNIGTDLSYPVGNNLLATGRIDYQFIGSNYSTPSNLEVSKNESIGLINLRAGLTNGQWKANAYVANAANEIKVQSSNVGYSATGVPIVYEQFVNRPRTIGVEVGTTF